jgi:hypothetical protein
MPPHIVRNIQHVVRSISSRRRLEGTLLASGPVLTVLANTLAISVRGAGDICALLLVSAFVDYRIIILDTYIRACTIEIVAVAVRLAADINTAAYGIMVSMISEMNGYPSA